MQPIIENLICIGDDRVAILFASLLNIITWATNEEALRRGIQRFAEEEPFLLPTLLTVSGNIIVGYINANSVILRNFLITDY